MQKPKPLVGCVHVEFGGIGSPFNVNAVEQFLFRLVDVGFGPFAQSLPTKGTSEKRTDVPVSGFVRVGFEKIGLEQAGLRLKMLPLFEFSVGMAHDPF